jgi:methylated-DNA-protein-cysteine methyltransferase-like protein
MFVKKSYFEKVYEITRLIPEGRVSTYGDIADYLALGSARMVGWALNHCHGSEDYVPAHRVVNRKGELSGRAHFKPPSAMQESLEAEGVKVNDHRIIDFDNLRWHPKELS